MTKITKAELLEKMEALKAEKEAKHKKLIDTAKKHSQTVKGREQIKAWSKAIATHDKNALKNISREVEGEYKSQNITAPADGGYLVPMVIEANILEQQKTISPLRQFLNVIPNAPAKLTINQEASRPTVGWTAEEAAYHQTDVTFAPDVITAHKLTGIVPITEEFMHDVANYAGVQTLLERQLAEEITFQENAAFISGDGTTRPLGFRNIVANLPASQVKTVADFTAISFDDVKGLKRAMKRWLRAGAFFLAQPDTTTALDLLKDGMGRYILNEDVTAADAVTRLLGNSYLEADELLNPELWFVNGSRYYVTDVTGIRIDFGYATGDFEEGRESLRVMKRTGGSPIGTEGFTVLKQGA